MCETRSFKFWLLQVLVLSALLVLILWLTLHTKSPNFDIQNLSVPVPSPPNINIANNQSSIAITFELVIQNPNKDYRISYSTINVTLYHGTDCLGVTQVADSLSQDKRETNHYNITVNANGRNCSEFLEAVASGKGELRADLVTRTQYRMGLLRSKPRGLNLRGSAQVGKDGKIMGKKKRMRLHKKSKKWR